MRCIEYNKPTGINAEATFTVEARTEVAQDETTEQVFSRKTDRKAYRQAVLKQRTAEAKRGNAKRETRSLGKEVKARSKARSR